MKGRFLLAIAIASYAATMASYALAQTATVTPTPSETPTDVIVPSDTPTPVIPTATPTSTPTSNVIVTEGISGEADAKHRGPTVYTRTENTSTGTTIFVDATITDDEFKNYPLKFDFFVNNRFFTSQMRSIEFPGPIGIDIPLATAVSPFNYTIVATLLHPNHNFTTVVYGTIFSTGLASILDCTLTTPTGDFTAQKVSLAQTDNATIVITFEATGMQSSDTASVSGSLTVKDKTGTGTLSVTQNGKTSATDVSGPVTSSTTAVTSLDVTSSDGGSSLSCS